MLTCITARLNRERVCIKTLECGVNRRGEFGDEDFRKAATSGFVMRSIYLNQDPIDIVCAIGDG